MSESSTASKIGGSVRKVSGCRCEPRGDDGEVGKDETDETRECWYEDAEGAESIGWLVAAARDGWLFGCQFGTALLGTTKSAGW